jgi:parallel beta-helix repeat protein
MKNLFILLILIGSVFAIPISECMEITSPGEYELIRDLSAGSIPSTSVGGNACIRVSVSQVSINCNDHIISGTPQAKYGILLESNNFQTLENIDISRCEIQGYEVGIFSPKTIRSSFTNLTVSDLSGYGLYFWDTDNSVFANNSVYDTEETGIYLSLGSDANSILNNSIRNSNHHGLAVMGNENQLLGNVIFDNRGSGIFVIGQSSGNTINLNTLYGNMGDGIAFESNGESRNQNLVNLDYGNRDLSAQGSASSSATNSSPLARPSPSSSACCAPVFMLVVLAFLSKSI